MRRFVVLFAVLASSVFIGAAALASSHDDDHEFPEHPHILVQRPVIELYDFGEGLVPAVVGVRKCVDLAANRSLPLGSQHHNVHFGTAGAKLFANAGHVVAPTAPFPGVPWANCADFLRQLPFPVPGED